MVSRAPTEPQARDETTDLRTDKNIGDVLKLDGAHASSILAYIQPLHEKQKAGKKAIPLKKGTSIPTLAVRWSWLN